MKIIIDEKVCLKFKLTLPEALFALAVRYMDSIDTIPNMLKREIIVEDQSCDWFTVTKKWSDILDKIMRNSGGIQDEERLNNLAEKMREAYPKGAIIDQRTGKPTSFKFRCNSKELAVKLKAFFTRYGDYSDEDILDAEKRYVAQWNGNYQKPGFRQLKYFIFKDEKKEGPDGSYVETISDLLTFLENKEEEGEEVNTNELRRFARN